MTMRDLALALLALLANPDADTEQVRDVADQLAGRALELSYMMSEPDWDVGMLEDVASIAGMDPNPADEPRWARH